MRGHRLHDPLILFGVAVAVVDAAHPTVAMVQNPIHRRASKSQGRNRGRKTSSAVMGRDAIANPEVVADRPHHVWEPQVGPAIPIGEDEALTWKVREQGLDWSAEPYAMAFTVLGPRPA